MTHRLRLATPGGPTRGALVDHHSYVALAARAAFLAQSFVLGVVLTRLLDPADVGTYFSLFSTSALLTALFGQGLPFAASRAVATDPTHGRVLMSWTVRRTLVPWVVVTVPVVAVVAGAGGRLHELGPSFAVTFAASMVMTGPQLLERVVSEIGRGARVDQIGILGDGVFSRSLFTIIAAALVPLGAAIGLVALLTLSQVSVLVFVAVGAVLVGRTLPEVAHPKPARTRSIYTRPLWVHALTTAFLAQGDLFIATLVLDRDQVARYGIAWRIGTIVTLPLVALTSVVPGRIYRAMRDGDVVGMRSMMRRPMQRAAIGTAVLFVLLAVAGAPALRLAFGTAYGGAYVPMLIIAAGQLTSMWAGPVGHVLIGANRERWLVIATSSSAATLAVLAPIGAWLLQETGVALASATSLLVVAVLRTGMGQRAIGARGWRSIWQFR